MQIKKAIKITSFEWILVGILLYELGLIFNTNPIFSAVLGGLGLIIVFFNAFFRLPHILPFYGVKRTLFFVYLFWNLVVILRSLLTTGFSGFSPFNAFGWPSLITPLIVFLGFRHLSLKSVFKFSAIYGIIGILITVLNFKDIFSTHILNDVDDNGTYIGIAGMSLMFLFSTSFMMLCHAFVPSKYRTIAFFAISLSILIALLAARRGTLFMNLLFLIFTFYLYVFSSKKSSRFIRLLFILTIVAVGIGTFFMYSDSAFSLFFSKLDVDSRGPVEEAFFDSFKGKPLDWIIGRGLNGTYYCTLFDDTNLKYRGIIETGYLYIILKGGLISLSMYVFFLLNSAYVGFFKTNNILTKAMALYLVAHVIYLQPFGLPSFSLEYVIVWICVLYCQSKVWRLKSDTDIKRYFGLSPTINRKIK